MFDSLKLISTAHHLKVSHAYFPGKQEVIGSKNTLIELNVVFLVLSTFLYYMTVHFSLYFEVRSGVRCA